jgi:hypothetical protein
MHTNNVSLLFTSPQFKADLGFLVKGNDLFSPNAEQNQNCIREIRWLSQYIKELLFKNENGISFELLQSSPELSFPLIFGKRQQFSDDEDSEEEGTKFIRSHSKNFPKSSKAFPTDFLKSLFNKLPAKSFIRVNWNRFKRVEVLFSFQKNPTGYLIVYYREPLTSKGHYAKFYLPEIWKDREQLLKMVADYFIHFMILTNNSYETSTVMQLNHINKPVSPELSSLSKFNDAEIPSSSSIAQTNQSSHATPSAFMPTTDGDKKKCAVQFSEQPSLQYGNEETFSYYSNQMFSRIPPKIPISIETVVTMDAPVLPKITSGLEKSSSDSTSSSIFEPKARRNRSGSVEIPIPSLAPVKSRMDQTLSGKPPLPAETNQLKRTAWYPGSSASSTSTCSPVIQGHSYFNSPHVSLVPFIPSEISTPHGEFQLDGGLATDAELHIARTRNNSTTSSSCTDMGSSSPSIGIKISSASSFSPPSQGNYRKLIRQAKGGSGTFHIPAGIELNLTAQPSSFSQVLHKSRQQLDFQHPATVERIQHAFPPPPMNLELGKGP